jgi:alpha-beta hydrolase superfamily lysophospholipase
VKTDVLGAPYEQRRIELSPDNEGPVVATLVRAKAPAATRRAVLYLHGFVDYFFQTHLAEFYTSRGYDFYALDLRKHGRSLLPHQTPNFTSNVAEYFAEIDEAVRIIRDDEGHDILLLNGHSTGGLTGALWAHGVRGRGLVQALFLNSPFFEFAQPPLIRQVLMAIIERVGRRQPMRKLPQELGTTYGKSVHRSEHGEWDYDLAWKPLNGYPIFAGWVRAIHLAQRELQAGLAIDVPILVACSTRSYQGRYSEAAQHADSVLNVDHMTRYATGLGRDVTVLRIEDGLHDLTLSRPAARQRLFDLLDGWLTQALGRGSKPDEVASAN